MTFEVQHTDAASDARAGLIKTDHGQIQTPIFMPVGTVGSVKGVHFSELREQVKAQIILGNTYHLYLRPGLEILRQAGGLHKFNTWDRPILTDSGGFQVFSLTGIRKLREEGCEFQSHIDGSRHIFTPENVMDTQRVIGADIMMAFDECPPGQSDYKYAENSLRLTQRWLERCVKRFNETEPLYGYNQTLFPIVQGCTYKDLRQDAAKHVCDILGQLNDGGGASIGGLAVGEPTEVMYEMIEVVNEILPKSRPRYLMGVGTPQNILEGIERGVDMFDCVMPTRNGRNAMLFTYEDQFETEAEAQAYLDENNIMFSLSFGPVMVEKGVDVTPYDYPLGEIRDTYARCAIGQLGKLHYLAMTINCQSPDYYVYVTLRQAADSMIAHGCYNAYTLDGGQTGSIIIGNELINPVQFGVERRMSDIFYFATAIPEN